MSKFSVVFIILLMIRC